MTIGVIALVGLRILRRRLHATITPKILAFLFDVELFWRTTKIVPISPVVIGHELIAALWRVPARFHRFFIDLPRILGALLLLFIIARPAIVFRPLATATAIFCARPWVIAPFVELKLPTNPHLHRTILRRYVQLIQVDSLRFT